MVRSGLSGELVLVFFKVKSHKGVSPFPSFLKGINYVMSPARMISYKLLNIRALFVFCQLLVATAENCRSESSVHGNMLRDHILKTLKTRDPMDCMQECHATVLCQSINYSILNGICELNNRTREARPEAFVADMGHIYMKRWSKRGTC